MGLSLALASIARTQAETAFAMAHTALAELGGAGQHNAYRREFRRCPAMCAAWPTIRGRGMGGIDRAQTRSGIRQASAWPSESLTCSRRTKQRGLTPLITTGHGTRFVFTDRYLAEKPGAFELRRNVVIQNAAPEDRFFNSLFGIEAEANAGMADLAFFVPGVWYKTNFITRMAGALAKNPGDRYFLFRECLIAPDRGTGLLSVSFLAPSSLASVPVL
jgi:hypothetical protein